MSHFLSPGPQQLLTRATAITTAGVMWVDGLCARLTIVIQGNGTITAGALQLEESYPGTTTDNNGEYTGTWSAIQAPIDLTALSTGEQSVIHLAGSFWHVRARISTGITGTGGSVDVWGWGN